LLFLAIGGQGVGVYLRTSSRQNKDGTTVRYLSIAHNERSPGGPSVAKVLLPLGREDRLDVAGLRRLVGSINRYLGDDVGSDAAVQVGAEPGEQPGAGADGGLRIIESARPAGRGCSTGCGNSWGSAPRCARSSAPAGSAPMSSG
jgi:hypothetical protein